MKRDLDEANNRFESAAEIDIITQWIPWLEYEEFRGLLSQVSRNLSNLTVAKDLQMEVSSYWDLRNAMRNTPLHPSEYLAQSHLTTGEFVLGGEIGHAIELLRTASRKLLRSENPMRLELERYLSGESRASLVGIEKVQLLVPQKFLRLLSDSLTLPSGRSQKVLPVGPTIAKQSNLAEVMFLFGEPEHYANFFKLDHEKSREVAWIFNAPSARQVVLFQLADSRVFDSSAYEIWPNSMQFDSKTFGNRPLVNIDVFEPKLSVTDVPPPSPSVGEPLVEAVLVHLLNDYYIYYSDIIPPHPICVRLGEFEMEPDNVRVSDINPGDVLVIRTGEASRLFLREHALEWLTNAVGIAEAKSFRGIADKYKHQLKLKYNDQDFVARLVAKGLPDHYVRNQIAKAFHPATIATQRKDNFLTISQELGLDNGDREWSAISKLQTAHRQAGIAAKNELLGIVSKDETWLDIVSQPGMARLSAGSAGEIVLIPVVQKPDQRVDVPISSIGQLNTSQRKSRE